MGAMDRFENRWIAAVTLAVLVGNVVVCETARVVGNNTQPHDERPEHGVPLNAGLSFGFYSGSCPSAENLVASKVAAAFKSDPTVAGGLLRLFFHDCFVQGCDGSILLRLPSGTELDDIPNQTIRNNALQLIADAKTALESACPRTVSCADIVVLATRSAVQQAGGPAISVPLGRRDSLKFSASTADLPGPSTTFQQQSTAFSAKGLDTSDLVALAGGHTLGQAHCAAFSNRILPTKQPKINPSYADYLVKNVCPTLQSNGVTGLDFYSPNKFDNQYFVNLPTGGALLESDQNLDQDSFAWSLVNNWANNQANFFNQFAKSFVKMSQIQTLTGGSGEVRRVCSTTNSGKATIEEDSTPTEEVSTTITEEVSTAIEAEPVIIEQVTTSKTTTPEPKNAIKPIISAVDEADISRLESAESAGRAES